MMGKTTRWIRSLFRPKSTPSSTSSTGSGKTLRQPKPDISYSESHDANKHAIAVAAATAAVAEAALAAAHAAAEVVRLTAGGGNRTHYDGERRKAAAVLKIQSTFRAYLARRALRALKGLVKLQALVRGRIVRKQSTEMLRRMQAMARVQARACASRSSLSASPHSSTRSSNSHNHHPKSTSAKGALIQDRFKGLVWLENWMDDGSWSSKQCRPDDERSDKILEVDTWKPRVNPSLSNKSTLSTQTKPWGPRSGVSREVLPLGSMIHREAEKTVSTAETTPRIRSPGSSHRRSPFSEYSRSVYGDFPSYPNYMANTESSRAKLRSHSAPRQRNLGSSRLFWDCSDTVSERGFRS